MLCHQQVARLLLHRVNVVDILALATVREGTTCTDDRQTDTSPKKAGHSSLNMKNTTEKCLARMEIKCSQRKNGTLRCSAGLEWHGYHGISDTEASAKAPAVGHPSKSAGCLAAQKKMLKKTFIGVDENLITFFAEFQYHSTKKSDPGAEPENRMTFKAFTVHQLSPYENPLDIVIETLQCRLRLEWMCTRSSGPHSHVQSREYHDNTLRATDVSWLITCMNFNNCTF